MGTVVPRLHQVWRGRIQLWNLGMESGEEAREGTCGEQKGAVGVHISAARRKHPVVFSCAGVAAHWVQLRKGNVDAMALGCSPFGQKNQVCAPGRPPS